MLTHYMFPHNFTFAKCESKRGKNSYCYTRSIGAVTCSRCLKLHQQSIDNQYYALIERAQKGGISIAALKQALGI